MSKVLKFATEVRINDGIITAVLSTERQDRDGDIIRARGWQLDDFRKAPRLLSCHVYDDLQKHIGRWDNVRIQQDKLIGEPNYFTDSGNQEAIYGDYLARRGEATYSVGFEPIEAQPLKGYRGTEYLKQALLETSHVPVPSNADALTLMAKAAKARAEALKDPDNWQAEDIERLLDAAPRTKDGPVQCCVSGCDDMSSAHVGVCADHLRALCALPPNPPSGVYGRALDEILDTQIRELYAAGRQIRSFAKAGRTISGSNMDRLHHALSDLHALHDPNCNDDSCAYAPDADGDDDGDTKRVRRQFAQADGPYEPAPYHADPDETVKCPKCGKMDDSDAIYCDQCGTKLAGRDDVTVDKAMGESSGAAGGVTVASDGSHAPFDGTHSHPHPAFGSQGDDQTHSHEHSHDGDADHGHSHAEKSAKAPMSTADQNNLKDSAFAAVLPGGKEEDGITTPKDLRLLPHHKADGSLDLPHLRNALARVNQIDAPADVKAAAERHLEAHAKEARIGDYADDGEKSLDMGALIEAAIEKASRQLEVK